MKGLTPPNPFARSSTFSFRLQYAAFFAAQTNSSVADDSTAPRKENFAALSLNLDAIRRASDAIPGYFSCPSSSSQRAGMEANFFLESSAKTSFFRSPSNSSEISRAPSSKILSSTAGDFFARSRTSSENCPSLCRQVRAVALATMLNSRFPSMNSRPPPVIASRSKKENFPVPSAPGNGGESIKDEFVPSFTRMP
ncbi:Uncharacterised protein [uncultured archaeon]|nr:Uncharacterised protein [uncultured archaeon]